MNKTTMAAVAAAALAAASPPLLADVDLNTFIHGGSMARPLAATTASAEAVLGNDFNSIVSSSAGATLGSSFDSWWQYFGEAILNGKFSTFNFPFSLIMH